MKKSVIFLVLTALFLYVPAASVGAHHADHNDYRQYGVWHYYQPYYFYQLYPMGQVTTPYWCGAYYSSWPCYYSYIYPQSYYYQQYDPYYQHMHGNSWYGVAH